MSGTGISSRRSFLALAAAGLAGCGAPEEKKKVEKRRARILLVARAEAGDMGSAASAAGLVRLAAVNVPRADFTLSAPGLDDAARQMIANDRPEVKIVTGEADAGGFDFVLHGSGEAANPVPAAKPYGFLGITVERDAIARVREALNGAAFVYTRERASLKNLTDAGLPASKLGYAPDTVLSFRLSNEAAAKTFLAENRIEPKKFIAVVPRNGGSPIVPAVIASWVRETMNKAVLFPERAGDVRLLAAIRAQLPADVRNSVVARKSFWLPDEAAALFSGAIAVVSEHYYSPLMAAGVDTPAMYLYEPAGATPAQVWDDLGLKRWSFDTAQAKPDQVWAALKSIHEHYAGVQVDAHEAAIGARRLQVAAVDRMRAMVEQAL